MTSERQDDAERPPVEEVLPIDPDDGPEGFVGELPSVWEEGDEPA